MKGIVLAGGTGSRLHPLTKITNKHLLPVYSKPMIFYPLFTLKEAGIDNVLIVSGRGHCGDFLEMLGSGVEMGMKLSYEVQDEAGGIAQALGLAKDFAGQEKVIVILGDNIFEKSVADAVADFKAQPRGAKIFLKEVQNPSAYGVAEVNEDGTVVSIEEKPEVPNSNLAVTGLYMYDPQVFEVIGGLEPSGRNELEITDVNNYYLQQGTLTTKVVEGFWGDCGESIDSLMDAARLVQGSRLASLKDNLTFGGRDFKTLSNEQHSNQRVGSL